MSKQRVEKNTAYDTLTKEKRKDKKQERKQDLQRTGAISKPANIVLNILFTLFTLFCILPFILIIILSFTDEEVIAVNGYSFLPAKTSTAAYRYIFQTGDQMLRSFITSVTVTITGTVIGVLMMAMYAYAIYRKDFRYRKQLTFLAFFTMLFNGGLVPFYIVCTQMLNLKDSIWSLILPMCMGPFYIMILRTFFQTSIPDSLIESATLDGAGEFRILVQIVFPISLPGIATIALFSTLDYWNDWFNAMLFIKSEKLYPLQYLLMSIQDNMDFLMRNSSKLTTEQASMLRKMPNESARMAMVFISTVPITLAYPFFQRYFIQGLQVGSVKG